MTSKLTRYLAAAGLAVTFAWLTGCGSGPKYQQVSGNVTFDGQAVPDGDITFVPENKAFGPTQGRIKDGRYEAKAVQGKNKVQVTASKIKPGGAKGAGGEPVAEDYIPEQFNVISTLSADVTSSQTQFDFKLDSKAK
jgi:hypothetical protein